MKLVIAEKEEIARAIRAAVGSEYTVCAASGHLLELVEPQDYDERLAYAGGKWDVADLPIFFRDWKLRVKRARDDKGRKLDKPDERASERLARIEELLGRADAVVNAGDPDDEGQRIVDEILEYLGYAGPVERVYVNDTIESNICREFTRLKPNAECARDGDVAYARAMADMVFGVNDTRLLVKRTGLRNVSLGRVQTPVLRMVVERDRAIENHVERLYYEVEANLVDWEGAFGSPPVKTRLAFEKEYLEEHGDGKRVYDRAAAQNAMDALRRDEPYQLHVTRRERRKAAPLPYTITQLEAEMSSLYGYSASETLAATQTLRDRHRAITYNRTSSPYLKDEHWQEARSTLGIAMRNVGAEWPLDYTLKSKAFDDAKCSAHHGIIPQAVEVDVSAMTEREANVYAAIVERYALQFLPPAVYDVCEASADTACGKLAYKASRVINKGWMAFGKAIEDDGEDADAAKPMIEAGEYTCTLDSAEIAEKKTAPPKRYTEKALLLDMASVSKYVRDARLREVMREKDADEPGEHGGIGTSATRHAILDTLKKRKFIEAKGKAIVSTERGRAVYDILPEGLGTVDTTARWYLVQEEIRTGRASANLLPEKVAEEFEARRDSAYIDVEVPEALVAPAKRYIGTCPRCGRRIVSKKASCQCETNRFEREEDGWKLVEGCGWSFSKILAGKKLTEKQVEALIAGKTVKVRGMKSKKNPGKIFDASVTVTDLDAGKVSFKFDNAYKPGRRTARKEK